MDCLELSSESTFTVGHVIYASPIRGNLETLTGTIRKNKLFLFCISETVFKLKGLWPSLLPHEKILLKRSQQRRNQGQDKTRSQGLHTECLCQADSEAGLHFPPLRLFNYVTQQICSSCLSQSKLPYYYLMAILHTRKMIFHISFCLPSLPHPVSLINTFSFFKI